MKNDNLVFERVGTIKFPKEDGVLDAKNKIIKKSLSVAGGRIQHCSPSLSKFISTINLTTDYDRLPDVVKFDYEELQSSGMDLKDVTEIIKMSYKLAAIRLNERPKEVVLTGFAHGLLNSEYVQELKDNNFAGGTLSVRAAGREHVKDASLRWLNDHSLWDIGVTGGHSIIVPEPKKLLSIDLTYRQLQVADMIRRRGMTNKQIAKEFGISEQAVKIHVSIILKKYGVKSRTQLILAMGNKW